jgi:cytoskeletal protein RodZ
MEQNTTIGTLLKSTRKKNNISIEQVAQQTKININILKSLEDDDLNNLPNKTYVRGFVRNYAKAVGLDINEAKNSLENTYNIKYGHVIDDSTTQNTLGSLQADNPEEDESEEMKETIISIVQGFLNKKIIYSLLGLVVLFFVAKGVVNFFSQLTFERETISQTPTEVNLDSNTSKNIFDSKASKKFAEGVIKTNSDVAEKKKIAAQLTAKKEIAKKEKAAAAAAAAAAKISEEKKLIEKVVEKKLIEKKKIKKLVNGKFPFKKFYPTPSNIYDLVKDAPETKDNSLLPPNIRASVVPGKQNVYIVATTQDTWISYKTDNEKIKRYVLRKGRRVLLKGDRILLFMGNFNATKVFLNNELVSAKTRTGVKSMIFPEKFAAEYELPLFPTFDGTPHSAQEYKANMASEETSEQQ